MYVTLSNGQEIRLHVSHKTFKTRLGERRGTEVKLVTNGKTFRVKSICHENDNFSKKDGRKFAAIKLLNRATLTLPNKLNKKRGFNWEIFTLLQKKEDRAAVFNAINPNLVPKKRKKN